MSWTSLEDRQMLADIDDLMVFLSQLKLKPSVSQPEAPLLLAVQMAQVGFCTVGIGHRTRQLKCQQVL